MLVARCDAIKSFFLVEHDHRTVCSANCILQEKHLNKLTCAKLKDGHRKAAKQSLECPLARN
jgi:hypothetical protein